MSSPFLTGAAVYAADVPAAGVLHLAYVRAPLAAARIRSIDLRAAQAAPGVVAVYAGRDLAIVPLWEIAMIPEEHAQPALADGEVRHVGERVVAVVAESAAAALDACDLVDVDYEPAVAVTDPVGAPACLTWSREVLGDDRVDDHVSVTIDHHIARVSVAPMEGHSVLAVPTADGGLTMHLSTQVPTAAQRQLCRSLSLPPGRIRVVTPMVGGGFGGKAAGAVVDHMVAGAIALATGRPVRYVEDRTANLMTMQGRGVTSTVELRAASDGTLTGLRARIVADAGAYPNIGAVEPGKTRLVLSGPYRLPTVDIEAAATVTNLPPVGAYRGPGRSEAAVMLERTLDVLAAELGVDAVEIRRRNARRGDELPVVTVTGAELDSGDYHHLLDVLEQVAGYGGLRAEQQARRARDPRGPQLGIGVALVVDSTAWMSRAESACVRTTRDGRVQVLTGSAAAGQDHARLYRDLVRSVLPVADDDIDVIEGDTGVWSGIDGSMGSRTAQLAGSAVLGAATELAAELHALAAVALEASVGDIVAHGGEGFGVRGVPASAQTIAALVAAMPTPPESSCLVEQPGATYPSAAHLSVVDVDLETGRVVPVRHVAVTDCGRVLDPVSAHGQVVGATVQGIAQALFEEAVFADDGTPRNPNFADYGIPAAPDVPPVEVVFVETPTPHNASGAKGVGEIGMIGAPVAVQNAVVDALRPFGVCHLDMPCTPEKVWAAVTMAGDRVTGHN